jgi:hypothetical protein
MEKNNLIIVSLVAIVAIVGMLFMTMNRGERSFSPTQEVSYSVDETAQTDMAGQAIAIQQKPTRRDTIPEDPYLLNMDIFTTQDLVTKKHSRVITQIIAEENLYSLAELPVEIECDLVGPTGDFSRLRSHLFGVETNPQIKTMVELFKVTETELVDCRFNIPIEYYQYNRLNFNLNEYMPNFITAEIIEEEGQYFLNIEALSGMYEINSLTYEYADADEPFSNDGKIDYDVPMSQINEYIPIDLTNFGEVEVEIEILSSGLYQEVFLKLETSVNFIYDTTN